MVKLLQVANLYRRIGVFQIQGMLRSASIFEESVLKGNCESSPKLVASCGLGVPVVP